MRDVEESIAVPVMVQAGSGAVAASPPGVHQLLLSLGVAVPSRACSVSYRSMIVAFLRAHARHKLPDLDVVLRKYGGKEAQLLKYLQRKYLSAGDVTGATPPAEGAAPARSESLPTAPSAASAAESDVQEHIRALYARHAPDKLPALPSVLAKYRGREAALLRYLAGKYETGSTSGGGGGDSGGDSTRRGVGGSTDDAASVTSPRKCATLVRRTHPSLPRKWAAKFGALQLDGREAGARQVRAAATTTGAVAVAWEFRCARRPSMPVSALSNSGKSAEHMPRLRTMEQVLLRGDNVLIVLPEQPS